jgi:hypothetical protein
LFLNGCFLWLLGGERNVPATVTPASHEPFAVEYCGQDTAGEQVDDQQGCAETERQTGASAGSR